MWKSQLHTITLNFIKHNGFEDYDLTILTTYLHIKYNIQ